VSLTYAIVRGSRPVVSGLPTTAAAEHALAAARASHPIASLVVVRSDGAAMVHDGEHLVSEAEWRASFMAGRFNGSPQLPAQPVVGPMPARRFEPPAPCVLRYEDRREAPRALARPPAAAPRRVSAFGAPWRDARPFDASATRRRA
jgi:hypothetical protein